MRILLLVITLFAASVLARGQGTWKLVELPESYSVLTRLNTVNPLAPTTPAIAASANGNLAFFAKHKEKGTGSFWYLEAGKWWHVFDFGLNGVPASQVLPFPDHTWTPLVLKVSNGVYLLNGSKYVDGNNATIFYFTRTEHDSRGFSGSADEVIPFRYVALDETADEVFFLGRPTVVVRKPPYFRPEEALGDYGIYRVDKWNGEYNALDPRSEPPVELIVEGTPDELGYQPVGPLYAAGGYLVFWSARGSLPRLERFNYQTGDRETLLSLIDKIFGEKPRRIHSAVTDERGNVYAAYSDTVGRIVVFPVKGEPEILHSFETSFPAGWPPSLLLHGVHEGRLLISHPSEGAAERDTLSELDATIGNIKTVLEVGEPVVGRVVSSIGQFAAHYPDGQYIVQVDNLLDNFGRLIVGKVENKVEEPGPKPSEPRPENGIPFRRR